MGDVDVTLCVGSPTNVVYSNPSTTSTTNLMFLHLEADKSPSKPPLITRKQQHESGK
jgi:hypothetical protein